MFVYQAMWLFPKDLYFISLQQLENHCFFKSLDHCVYIICILCAIEFTHGETELLHFWTTTVMTFLGKMEGAQGVIMASQ